MSSSCKYNFMFEQLTDGNPDDLLGLIAYGLYKKDKFQFIQERKISHQNNDPSEDDLTAFYKAKIAEIGRYRQVATERLSELLDKLSLSNLEAYKKIQKQILYELEQERNSSRKFNFIFGTLTDNDPDNLLGLIAYSIYKNDKIRFIEEWKKDHPDKKDEGPSDEAINGFHKESARHIDHYKELAKVKLSNLMDDLLSEHIEEYKQAAKDGKKEALAELVKTHETGMAKIAADCKAEVSTLQSPWWKSLLAWLGSGIVGNIGFCLLLFILWITCKAWIIDMVGSIYRAVKDI